MKHHAFTFGNVLCGGIIYAALGFVQIAQAGFAQLRPPDGYQSSPTGSTFRAPANEPFMTGSAQARATLNIGGKTVEVPAKFRVAANAGTYAARYMFKHPALLTALGFSFLVQQGLEWRDGQWQTNVPNTESPISTGFHYYVDNVRSTFTSAQQICQHAYATTPLQSVNHIKRMTLRSGVPQVCQIWAESITPLSGSFVMRTLVIHRFHSPNCPAGFFITPSGCVQSQPIVVTPINEEQFIARVAPQIQPEHIPDYLPRTVPIPIERPIINPTPQPFPLPVPYVPPQPRPLIVPLADPVMIPNTEPQQWRQPLVQINPSPTAANPWRVSLNPKERITTSPHGITDPVSDLDPATPAQPSAESDFCIRNPEVLACARVPEFDIPNDEIQTLTEVISYEPEQFLGGGSCPRPVTVNLGGHTITAFDTPLYCQFISSYFRPVLLAIAAFSSMMIVAGGFRSV